jgi:hypothetical protein
MKKCLVYGNCQSSVVRLYLHQHSEFAAHYELLDINPVHLLEEKDVSYLESIVRAIDLFIYQPVSSSYRGIPQLSTDYLKSLLKPTSQTISFPVAYFIGYNPEIYYLRIRDESGEIIRKDDGSVPQSPYAYHDKNILTLFSEGKGVDTTARTIKQEDFYAPDYVVIKLEETLSNLRLREQTIDLKISDFIEENFRKFRLFHVFNHPATWLIAYVTDLILKAQGFTSRIAEFDRQPDLLAQYSFPIYPSLAKTLALEFETPFVYQIDSQTYSAIEVIENYFKFYDSCPALVRRNLLSLQKGEIIQSPVH